MKQLLDIAAMFATEGTPAEVLPMGEGLINDTYRVKTAEPTAPDYVLQRINHNIFTDVPALQRNIEMVTNHLREKHLADNTPDIDRHVLQFIPLKGDNRTWVEVDGQFWRMSRMIERSHTVARVTPETARLTGATFGRFQAMLIDLPEPLTESIPRFHDMNYRLQQLRDAVAADRAGRLAEVADMVEYIESRAEEMTAPERLHAAGLLPKRPCHCDTKVNNMLFDNDTDDVLAVIDLDTVMPSFVSSDYGDFLRTAASTRPEDEPEAELIDFDMDVYHAFTEGYLSTAGVFLTQAERDLLPLAAKMFPYMQAVRFLADYLNGDTYYKIAYPTHNLVRTRAQLALLRAVDRRLA